VLLYAGMARTLVVGERRRLAIVLLFAKLLLFLALGWLVLGSGRAHGLDPGGFVLGVTCFPAAAVWEAVRVRGS
jgi:hypothetical protein